MNFNGEQLSEIYRIMNRYNNDSEYKASLEDTYDNNIEELSMLSIYTLEEVLRYGTKEIYNKFLAVVGEIKVEEAVLIYDNFMATLDEDTVNVKVDELNEIEKFALDLYRTQMEREPVITYDPLNPILYGNDEEIRTTLKNLFFGELIHKIITTPEMRPAEVRMLEDGMISNIDKENVINKIKDVANDPYYLDLLEKIIDSRMDKVKANLDKGIDAFKKYSIYNTNILYTEIIDTEIEKEKTYHK